MDSVKLGARSHKLTNPCFQQSMERDLLSKWRATYLVRRRKSVVLSTMAVTSSAVTAQRFIVLTNNGREKPNAT